MRTSSGSASSCGVLQDDERVQKALGDDRYDAGMSCAELGAAVKAVTVGAEPGAHSLRQAQAMKDVLLAVADSLDETGGRLDPELRLPLGEMLSGYRADLQQIMGLTPVDYVRHGPASKPAWEDDEGGVHVSVSWKPALLPVVRAVSEDPGAYAVIRDAMTGQAADGLAAMKPDSTGDMLSAPPARSSWALGSLDGVAADVVGDLERERGQEWQTAVLDALTPTGGGGKGAAVPVFSRDAEGYLVARWRRHLAAEGTKSLEAQGASMFGDWCDAVGVTGAGRDTVADRAGRGQRTAGREVLADLGD
ncbi:hypothetical protein [Streptomyces sp. NBC_01012]|uniref:hypothetical protein n=1 Tax=Streptomyces sp. NBC_01012 TaxID=2903717 RepID=UPI0038657EC6|nr:hypothetical protein OG623_12550 [Streptomyces sp. NBC_01012]